MAVSIKIDSKQMKKTLNKLSTFPKEINKASSAAINRTLTFSNKKLKQEVKKTYNIKAGEIQSTIKIKKSNPSKLSGEIISDGNRLTLGRFSRSAGNWKKGKKIKVKVKKSGTKPINTTPKAFIANLNGNNHIVKREGKSRYPIKVLKTLSIPQMISNTKVSDVIMDETNKQLQKRLEHEVEYRLLKKMKG
ncbi:MULTISPECIES: phage tail protein [unclassified Clostridium]|uniref:phage tail protein n=1 Tax=unclassified Clostridium TaxID=2614128 RepID=UPI0020792DFB|nr:MULTISPECIES: phage tail protein [unclassified Clostridium]